MAGYVQQANADMSAGLVKQIEIQAQAKIVTAQQTAAKAEAVSKNLKSVETRSLSASAPAQSHSFSTGRASSPSGPSSAGNGSGNSSSAEAAVYGDIASQMLGVGGASNFIEFFDVRRIDAAASGVGHAQSVGLAGAGARTMEQMIGDTLRSPGSYASAVGAETLPSKGAGATGLIERSNIASTSLKGQGDMLSTWSVQATQMASVKMAKDLTIGVELASKPALASVQLAQQQHAVMNYSANQMAPGMSLQNGPSIKPAELLTEAKQAQDDGRWRGGSA